MENHNEHVYFKQALETEKGVLSGKITDEELQSRINESIESGRVTKEELFSVLPQSNNLRVGDIAPNGKVYHIDSGEVAIPLYEFLGTFCNMISNLYVHPNLLLIFSE